MLRINNRFSIQILTIKNMNIFTKIKLAVIGAVAFIALPAVAQVGFDAYGQMRTLILAPPTILVNGGAAASTTNVPVDTHGFEGVAKVDIMSCTNSGGALTALLYTSPDLTNWTALANYSLAQSSSIIYTNLGYGNATNLQATNVYNLPGAVTTPTANTAGFATAYLDNSSPFTNSGAITITTKKIYTIGYNIQDAARYVQIVWTPTGSSSNDIVAAVITARKQQFP
jgi:hypothetical protein